MRPRRFRAPRTAAFVLMLAAGCAKAPTTIAIHHPICPTSGQDVTYTLQRLDGSKLSRVELYERVSKLDPNGGVISTGNETLLRSWRSPGNTAEFVKPGGYLTNLLVRYRFVVKARSGIWPLTETYDHEITFETWPETVNTDPQLVQPIPIYAVGDPAHALDIVFIPDSHLETADMAAFRENCGGVITDAFLHEPTTRLFRRAFNFWINPLSGTATDWGHTQQDGYHRPPANWDNISFAESHVLMHKGILWDYTLTGLHLCSTEMQNRGTVLHESGHALFGLVDEYNGGWHQKIGPLPNNWNARADAEAAASSLGKKPSDAVLITSIPEPWWKLCNSSCQMDNTGAANTNFDAPCRKRVIWCVERNAQP